MKRVVAFITFAFACSPALAERFNCSQTAASPYPGFVATDHDHRRFAPEPTDMTRPFTAFFADFDDGDDDDGDGQPDIRLNPQFVIYELRGVAPAENGNYDEPDRSIQRPNRWYASPDLVPLVDSIPGVTNARIDNSYSGIGDVWNRGHLAMSEHAQRISGEAACNTHHFWNASPQAQDLNQGPWRHLEDYSAAASNKYRSIWVVAGPIYDSATPRLTIGDGGEPPVEVPDAFFKILIHEGPSGIQTLAFIYEQPNALGAPDPQGRRRPAPTATWVNCNRAQALAHVYDHRPRLVSIAQIEQRTGLRLFSGRPDRDSLIAARPTELWPVEERYWDGAVCARQRSHP